MNRRYFLGALALSCIVFPALASGGGGHGFSLREHGFYIINFILFFGTLGYLLRTPLNNALAARSDAFKTRLETANENLADARKELADAEEKAEWLEEEKLAIAQKFAAEGTRFQQMVAERKEEEVKKLEKAADLALESEKIRLEKQFTTDVALSALVEAETRLDATWSSLPQDKLVDTFVAGVETLASGRETTS